MHRNALLFIFCWNKTSLRNYVFHKDNKLSWNPCILTYVAGVLSRQLLQTISLLTLYEAHLSYKVKHAISIACRQNIPRSQVFKANIHLLTKKH